MDRDSSQSLRGTQRRSNLGDCRGPAALSTTEKPRILSRIYVTEDGDLVITDLWETLEKDLTQHGGMEIL